MKQWVVIVCIIASVLFVLGVIIQIIWIRNKMYNFEESKLASEMTQQAKITSATSSSRSNLAVYSVMINLDLTSSLNTEFNAEYNDLLASTAPKSFSVPHICNNVVKSAKLSCNDIQFLVLQSTTGSANLLKDIASQAIMYVMISGKLYLIDSNPIYNKGIQDTYPDYVGYEIIYLYAIASPKNIVLDTSDTCLLDLVPFYGTLSTTNTVDFPTSTGNMQLHILGYYKSSL